MKTDNDLLKLGHDLVAYGRKKGADEVEVSIGEGSEFSVDIRDGNIEKLVEAGSRGMSLKVILDKKVATASSSDFSSDTLHQLMDQAIERAKLSTSDPYAGLPDYEPVRENSDALRIYDPEIVAMKPEAKIKAARETEAIAMADPRVSKSFGSSFATAYATLYLVNSKGFSGSFRRTGVNCGVYLQAGEGDNLFDEGDSAFARNLGDLRSPESIAKEAVHRVTRLIGARKIETQTIPVILEPRMTSRILGFLYACINGTSIYMKRSFLTEALNQSIADSKVTVIDDGLLPGGPGTRPFDGEGVPCRKTVVIDKGVLKSYLLDTYAARKLGMKSTGNGSGSTNFYLAAGDHSPEEIIRSTEKGLLLTGTIGQGTVPTTGDISTGAFGMMIENGRISYPVAEITISGNLGQMLKGVQMIGNDLEFNRSVTGPTIKIDQMIIGGK